MSSVENNRSPVDINSFKLLVAILVIHTVGPQTVIVLPGFVQGLVEYAGFSDKQAGVIASAELWGMTVSAIAMMFLVARVNWRHAMTISVLLLIFGNFLTIPARDFYLVCALRFLVGVGGGVIVALSYAIFGLTRKSDRNFGLGIMFVLVYGAVVFPLIPALFSAGGLPALLIFFGGFSVLGLFFVRYMPASGEEHREIDERAVDLDWQRKRMALAAMLIYFIACFAVWSYLFRIGVSAGLSEQQVGNGLSASQFFGIAGAFTTAMVGARFGRSLPLTIGIGGSLIPVFFLFNPPGVLGYAAIACVFNYAWNMTHPYLLAAMASFDPSGENDGICDGYAVYRSQHWTRARRASCSRR